MTAKDQPTSQSAHSERNSLRRTPLRALLWAAGIFFLVVIVWLNIPAINPVIEQVANIGRSPTPTVTITATPSPTRTPTSTSIPTETPLPSQTPMPHSAYSVDEMGKIAPPSAA